MLKCVHSQKWLFYFFTFIQKKINKNYKKLKGQQCSLILVLITVQSSCMDVTNESDSEWCVRVCVPVTVDRLDHM